MTDWLPIEIAPSYGYILGWVPFDQGGGILIIIYKDDCGEWRDDNDDLLAPYVPACWMPLPAPPSNAQEAEKTT